MLYVKLMKMLIYYCNTYTDVSEVTLRRDLKEEAGDLGGGYWWNYRWHRQGSYGVGTGRCCMRNCGLRRKLLSSHLYIFFLLGFF